MEETNRFAKSYSIDHCMHGHETPFDLNHGIVDLDKARLKNNFKKTSHRIECFVEKWKRDLGHVYTETSMYRTVVWG